MHIEDGLVGEGGECFSGLLIYVSTGVNELLPGWHRVVWFGVRFECIRRGGGADICELEG